MTITARRRVLGAGMRELREGTGLDLRAAAELAVCPPQRIIAVERGTDPHIRATVRRLLDVYGVDEARRTSLLELAQEANRPGWWSPDDPGRPTGFSGYLALEPLASEICIYQSQVIPGLFQTSDYARAQLGMHSVPHDPRELERRVQLRVGRRRIFDRAGAPKIWLVMDEDAIVRPVGGARILRAQLDALLGWIAGGALTIQILASGSADTSAGMCAPFTVLSFDQPHGRAAYADMLIDGFLMDQPDIVRAHHAEFHRLTACALSPERSRELLAEAMFTL